MRVRTTITWGNEDGVLLKDMSRFSGKAKGNRLKRLAKAGLLLERMGVCLDSDGDLRGLAVNFHGERQLGVLPVSEIKQDTSDHSFGMSDKQSAGFDAFMDNVM